MKKSIMVKKIHELLRREDHVGVGYAELAKQILNLVQEEGMHPPFNTSRYPAGSEHLVGVSNLAKACSWEQE